MDELLDIATYNGMKELLEDEFPAFLDMFFSENQESLDKIRKGLEDSDPDLIKAAAHNLKSSCGYIGAVKLSDLARVMEETSSTGSVSNIDTLFAESQSIFDTLKTNLS